jgi:hypothetical protein
MKIAPVNADVNKQVQANANILSSIGKTPDFAKYLRNGNENAALAVNAPADMEPPAIDEMARQMWGTAYDPATRSVKLDALASNTQSTTDAFARKLGGLLRAQGIDTNSEITLTTGYNGAISVVGEHPQKQGIEALFFANPALGDEYRKISSDNDMVAMGKLTSEYSKRWSAAANDSQRQGVFNYFAGLFDQAKRLGGQMTLDKDMLSSASLRYSNSMVRA